VQDGAGQVEYRPQIGAAGFVGPAANGGEQGAFVGQRQAVPEALAGGGQFGADAAGDRLAAVAVDGVGQLLEQAVDGRKVDSW